MSWDTKKADALIGSRGRSLRGLGPDVDCMGIPLAPVPCQGCGRRAVRCPRGELKMGGSGGMLPCGPCGRRKHDAQFLRRDRETVTQCVAFDVVDPFTPSAACRPHVGVRLQSEREVETTLRLRCVRECRCSAFHPKHRAHHAHRGISLLSVYRFSGLALQGLGDPLLDVLAVVRGMG